MTLLTSLAVRILAVVVLLSLVAAGLGLAGVMAVRAYGMQVAIFDRASTRELIGERVNKLIYQSVMDSRGIYMPHDHTESEIYAPLVLATIAQLPPLMREWTALIDPENAAAMQRVNDRVAEYIAFRTELVRLSRQSRPPQS